MANVNVNKSVVVGGGSVNGAEAHPSNMSRSSAVVIDHSTSTKTVCHYDRAGVFVRFEYASEEFPEDDSYVRGAITIVEKVIKQSGLRRSEWTLSWSPRQEEDDWLMIQSFIGTSPTATAAANSVKFHKGAGGEEMMDSDDKMNHSMHSTSSGDCKESQQSKNAAKNSKVSFSIDLESIIEIRKVNPGMGWPVVALFGEKKLEPLCPLLEFLNGGVKELFEVIKKVMSIKKSKTEENTWYLKPRGQDWTQSLHALNVNFNDNTYIAGVHSNGAVDHAVVGLSRVKNYVFDNLLHQSKLKKTRPADECVTEADLESSSFGGGTSAAPAMSSSASRFGINNRFEPGYDMITCVTVEDRPVVRWERGKPIDEMEYSQLIDNFGRITDPHRFLQRVFEGGIVKSLRSTLWKYLLNYYSYSLTLEENLKQRKQKEDEYFRMKLQWKTMSREQIQNFTLLREKLVLVEKDVIRTDRTDDFFKGTLVDNVNLCKLYDILMTYCMYNFDLGYLQGMSDLLAPLLMVLEDEVDTFWCFVGLMKLTATNFDMDDEKGMKLQMTQLKYLLNLLDPSFYAFLESKESGNLYFCFRWLLVWFKREFTFIDICSLWEVLWTQLPCANFHLFICLSMLDLEKSQIMAQNLEFTEILKHINEVQLRMNVSKVLKNAEAIFLQIKNVEDMLPDKIKQLLLTSTNSSRVESSANQNQSSSSGDGIGLSEQADEDEVVGMDLNGGFGFDSCANTSFSEMYKSVNFTSPSLIVPPLDEDESEELTL